MDINTTCRLCLSSSEELVCIFDEETKEIISEISELLECIGVSITLHAQKSSIMCMKCYVKLRTFKTFHNNCIENEKVWDEFCEEQQNISFDKKIEIDSDDNDYDGEVEEPVFVITQKPSKTTTKTSKKKIVTKRKLSPTVVVKTEPLEEDLIYKLEEKKPSEGQLSDMDIKIQEFYDLSCENCEPFRRFETLVGFRQHMRRVHDDENPIIWCCDKKLTKRYQLIQHMSFHAEPKRLACDFCQKIYTDKKGLTAHIKRKHGTDEDKRFQCDICKKRYVDFEPMKNHVMSHLSKEAKEALKIHLCNQCGQTFMYKHTLQAHIKFVHLKQGYICDLCAKHFKSRFDYELHRRNEHGEAGPARAQCPICEQWYSNEKAVREHIRYLHERTEKSVCKICGEELSSKPSLRSHMKMKHREKTHKCAYCDKALPTATRLKEHEAMHTGISLYNCLYCSKEFNMKSNLYKHLKAIHPDEWLRDKEEKNKYPDLWKSKHQIVMKQVAT